MIHKSSHFQAEKRYLAILKNSTMRLLNISILCLVVVAAVMISEVTSVCCPAHAFTCGDNTAGTPYCGYGRCNWLGCNCRGGCRHLKRNIDGEETVPIESREETVAKLRILFKNLDTDKDNHLTKSEVASSGIVNGNKVDSSIAETDTNRDGKIALHEFENLA